MICTSCGNFPAF
uniref:Uncharacterized protein n=1 Tax=Anguilla anguilla TaxID=7936 RepID=A0A0E9V8D9_ANGAN